MDAKERREEAGQLLQVSLCDKQSPSDVFYPSLAQWDSVQASHQSASRSSLGGEHEVLQTVQQV